MTDHLPAVSHSTTLNTFEKMTKAAAYMARSNFFGFKTPEQAMSIMLLAEAEGMHPAAAMRDYHVIQGRPTLRSDAMLARFQAAGGTVEWEERTDKSVIGVFSHPNGGSLKVDWNEDRAKQAGILGNPTWKKYPRQMLTARCISEGVRAVFPGVAQGLYTPEEAEGMDPIPQPLPPAPEPDEPEVTPQDKDPIIERINSYIDEASLDAYVKRKANAIAEMPKPRRDAVQKAIREKRDSLKEAPPAGDPEVVEGEIVTPEDQTDEPAPDTAVGRFCAAMEDKIKKAPTAAKLESMWDRHKPKLDRVKDGDRDAWKSLYEMKTERAKILEEFEAEDA